MSIEDVVLISPIFFRSKRGSDDLANGRKRKRSASIDLQNLEKAEIGTRQVSADSHAQGEGEDEEVCYEYFVIPLISPVRCCVLTSITEIDISSY